MAIDSVHPEYALTLREWRRIDHITQVRNLDQYLVRLNPQDMSQINELRNQTYRERAVFYAFAAQTAQGLLGTMFSKDPILRVPPILDYLQTNADGAGQSLYQQAQGLADDVIRKSRAGIYVGFPATDGAVSAAQMASGEITATIHRFAPERIINWHARTVGNRTVLVLVILEEIRQRMVGYDVETYRHFRELYLDEEGVYRERHWSEEDMSGLRVVDEIVPTDAEGNVWREIPFSFVGSENNDHYVDRPNLLTLVDLNIGHYRNSADWEDSVWYCGQPQPYMIGLSEDHIAMMQEHGMYVGSRQIIGVPEGGSFGFAAPPPNPLVRQAMLDKVEMMLALGARMIQPGSAPKTATQIAGERETQHSILSLAAANISEAYTQALQWVGRYMGVAEDDEVEFLINQEFVRPDASPQELQAIMAGFVQGSIPMAQYIRYMQRAGLFDESLTSEDLTEELQRPGSGLDLDAE